MEPSAQREALIDRFLVFSVQVSRLIDDTPKGKISRNTSAQLVKAVTSIGANFEEAQAAESREDFVHKLQVSLKEARETCYWLKYIQMSAMHDKSRIAQLVNESFEIRAILTKAVMTTKKRYFGTSSGNG